MTDRQAKLMTMATLKSHRLEVLEYVFGYLREVLSTGAANYLSTTGNLSILKSNSSVRCELFNVLQSGGIDPRPLIVRKVGKRRFRVSYKGMYLHDYIKRRNTLRYRPPWEGV